MADPFENYGVLQALMDIPYSELGTFYDHTKYVGRTPELIEQYRPDVYGPRYDRSQMDMMINFMGGYDMAARGTDPQLAREGAKAYQYLYTGKERMPDAVGDYQENVAGIDAYNPEQGRLSDEALIDLALQFAQQRMGQK